MTFCQKCGEPILDPTKYQRECTACIKEARQKGQRIRTLKIILRIPDKYKEKFR